MNRDKIVDIATTLPREAYIDLLCAGVFEITNYETLSNALLRYRNLSYNQANALIEAYRERKEDKDE